MTHWRSHSLERRRARITLIVVVIRIAVALITTYGLLISHVVFDSR